MDEKQGPASYADAVSTLPTGGHNAGYAPPIGDQGGIPQPNGPQQVFPSAYYGHGQTSTVVMNQPVTQGIVINTVPDNMGLAIFTCICCFWPLGLLAIMKAQESRSALDRGDLGTAWTMSAEARRYSMWGIIAGIISSIVAIITIVVVVVNQISYYPSY